MLYSEGIQTNPSTDAALVDAAIPTAGTYRVLLILSSTVAVSARFGSSLAPNAILVALPGQGTVQLDLGKTVYAASAALDVLVNAGVSGDVYAALVVEAV